MIGCTALRSRILKHAHSLKALKNVFQAQSISTDYSVRSFNMTVRTLLRA